MKQIKWIKLLILSLGFIFGSWDRGQALLAQSPVLQDYILQGLESNQGLKQKKLDYASSLAALKASRGLFFPDISFNARFTVAQGGRQIEFPVGDLLNPVYSTLNLLTASDAFPNIENESFPFLRPVEQETKMSLVQPIFSSDIIQNHRINEQQVALSKIDVDHFTHQLVKEISKAYYGFQKASNLVGLADTTLNLVNENLRVSRRLFENDKVTIDAVYRSESELSKVEVQRAQAVNMFEASRAYFNFLLNRDLNSPILMDSVSPEPVLISLEDASLIALANRTELEQINEYQQLNKHLTNLYRGKNKPGLFGVIDYGIQGEDYSIRGEDDFVMASLVMQWNLFQGSSNRHKVQESKIKGEKLEVLMDETRQQIRLDVINQYYALKAAFESVRSANKQTISATRAYELINRRFREGQSSLLELIDARTSLTGASANAIIARSEYFIRKAEFEHAMGLNHTEYLLQNQNR
jgi:outer membrane protein TolC